MASMEKLIKAFEALKVFHPTTGNEENISKKKEQPLTKKDKIGHCTTIADAMCSANLRSVNDFPKFLGIAMETFLLCCDDEESDVRMVADECLNRTIKTLLETNLGRLQVELYKEIKKNGPARCLRAALWRFADLCHLIRPQRCRPYVVNLLPCIHRISNRPEDTVQETLASAMLKICPVLGKFTNDAEVKALLKCFLPNLKSSIAVTRRTAATSLTVICQYCRKPSTFFAWLLCFLLDMVIPVYEDRNVYMLLGVLLCLRHIIPHLGSDDSKDLSLKGSFGVTQMNQESKVNTDQLIQVYEILLHYSQHSDHNVVAASLETLQQLFRTPPSALLAEFLSSKGFERTRIFSTDIQDRFRGRISSSGSHLTNMPSLIEDDIPLDDDPDSKSEIGNHTIGSEETLPLSNDSDAPELVLPIPDESTSFEDDQDDNSQVNDSHGDIVINNNFNDEYSNICIGDCSDDHSPSHSSNLEVDLGLKPSSPSSPTFRIRKGVSEDGTDEFEETLSRDTGTPASPVIQVPFRVGNIGNLIDPGIPLYHCVRLLSSSFLLTGYPNTLMPDKNVRVSIKVLALGSIANMVNLYPQCFFIPLFIPSEENILEDGQQVSDVLLYVNHGDPQMRGQAALLIGNLIQAVLCEAHGRFDYFVQQLNVRLPIEELVTKLLCVLQDDSSIACRLAILAFKSCVHSLLNSLHCHLGPRILEALVQLNFNPYWLVKVELLELLGEIDFKVVSFLETLTIMSKTAYKGPGGQCLQEKVISEVLLVLLGDEDYRVRHAAAMAIVRVVSKLFCPVEHPQQDPIIVVARELTNNYFDPILHETSFPSQPMVHGLVKPFDTSSSQLQCCLIEAPLSRIINAIVSQLICSTSKYLTYGCCQALCLLSEEYLVTQYAQAWGCHPGFIMSPRDSFYKSPGRRPSIPTSRQQLFLEGGAGSGPLALILSLLTSSSIAWDLSTHQYGLQFAGNLFSGAAFKALKMVDPSTREEENWGMLQDKQLIPLAELLLTHLARLLNICSHVIEEQNPGPPQTKPALPSLPNAPSLSPIRRKRKVKGDINSSGIESSNQNKGSPVKIAQDKSENEKEKGQKSILGTFYNLPHYMKLYDILKGAYSNYKISLDMQSNEKFGCVLHCCLEVLSQMMEIATLQEVGRHAEELLGYLKSTISLEATMSVLCVQQLLKCLFGTNLAGLWEGPQQNSGGSRKPGKATRLTTSFEPGLYHCCFTTPYTQFTQSLTGSTLKSAMQPDAEDTIGWWGWMRRKGEKKLAALMKSGQKGEKTSIASYIRLFEPLVIRALRQYTVTSSIELQCQVLHLLAQLVQLRVNYCLLDSDQIFIGFVIKQFEYIEEGQIRNAEMLIPYIFNFLVLLSYERYHSKTIIGVPKIIQLCDGIMASGQPAKTHAIPALQPVLQDLFLIRGANKIDAGKELDTQREVIVSMLLRLIQYHQVLEMVIVVLQQSLKEGEDKWKRMSRQVIDIILPLLDEQQINLDDQVALDVLHRLFEAVAPSVFRPVDILLKKLFAKPYDVSCLGKLQRWLCLVLVCLRVLIAQAKEEVVLSRMSELGLTVNIFKDSLSAIPSDPLKRSMTNIFLLPPEDTIARFLLQTIGLISGEICRRSSTPSLANESYIFLCQQLAHLLLYVTHMFQSGIYRRVATAAMSLVKEDTSEDLFSIDEINKHFLDIAICHPTLTLMWCNVLILINYEDQEFWSKILRTVGRQSLASPRHGGETKTAATTCCHLELVKTGGLILFCDYVCVNLNDAEHTTWLIINHVNELICLSKEPPVQDFISAIHRNFAASGLFIQAIHARGAGLTKPHLVKRTLECVMTIHPTQSGALLTLLIDKFLNTPHVALARICDRLACKRVEDLLTESPEDCGNRLPLEDLEKLLQLMKSTGLTKRYSRLTSLLNKLRNILSPDSKLTLSPDKVQPLALLSLPLPDVTINKEWFISITKDQCFSADAFPSECAQLLQKLSYEDILNIMIDKEFNLSILEACLTLGVENMTLKLSSGSINSGDFSIEDSLYQAATVTLLQHISHLVGLLPRPHQVLVLNDGATAKEQRYLSKLEALLLDNNLWTALFLLLPVLTRYLKSLKQLYWKLTVSDESAARITRIAIFGLEAVDWLHQRRKKLCIQKLQVVVDCMASVLQNPRLVSVLGNRDHTTWMCSSIGCIHRLLRNILHTKKLPTLNASVAGLVDADVQRANLACDQIAELVMWLEKVSTSIHTSRNDIPGFLSVPFKNIIVGLARLPLVNSFARTPPLVWQMGWMPEMSGEMKTVVPPLPVEFLQERDVLRQFIFRVTSLGWTSRQQFEEMWMALLGVLSAIPSGDGTTPEEKMEHIHTSCLAVKSITSLLLMTLLTPQPGNPGSSVYQHYQRDKPLGFLHTRCGKKLAAVRNLIHQDIHTIFESRCPGRSHGLCADHFIHPFDVNLERLNNYAEFSMGQVCLGYIWSITGMYEDDDSDDQSSPVKERKATMAEIRERHLSAGGLDLHSCLHFLLDLYSHWLNPQTTPKTPLTLLTEATKSVVALSDIFTEHAQFEWMLDTLMELLKTHPAEDEIMSQYLILGICKAAAVLGVVSKRIKESEQAEKVKKLVEAGLRSAHLPTRIATLYGLLYIIEQGSTEEANMFIPLATDYLIKYLDTSQPPIVNSDQHVLVMWATVFYIIENYQEEANDADFASRMLQLCIAEAGNSENKVPFSVYLILMWGLERLWLTGALPGGDGESLVKLSVDRLSVPSPQRALVALGLLLACMYAGKEGEKWSPSALSRDTDQSQLLDSQQTQYPDPEILIIAMERVAVLFDRIKKGFPFEAEVIARILPVSLADFFPIQDIMNKVIGEFLSSQQPHPHLMATVVFQVFESLHAQGKQSVIRDWVMLSLSNFTQRSPLAMAIWSLTCFFVSASTNTWLRALFPHVRSRMGKLDTMDRKLFCLAALDFRSQLKDEVQQKAFRSTMQSVAKDDNPYVELLTYC